MFYSPTPNGDSSSAASRQSPARLCARGKIAHIVGTEAHSLGKIFMPKAKGKVYSTCTFSNV